MHVWGAQCGGYMHAEKLPEFEHFAPWWNTGGCVSELERAADMRRSCQRGLEDAESELLGARFGQSHGEIYDAVRGHAKRLGDALNSGAEAQKMLAAKIERYAARLDRQKRTFEGMRQQAAKVHAEHQNSLEAYNRALEVWYAAPDDEAARVAKMEVEKTRSELDSAIRDWNSAIGKVRRERREFIDAVDTIAADMRAGTRPEEPLTFIPHTRVTHIAHDDAGVDDALVRIRRTENLISSQVYRLESLVGHDDIRGREIHAAVHEFDSQWQPYLELARWSLGELGRKVAEFRTSVEDVDQASAFSFDSMKLDIYSQRGNLAQRNSSGIASGAMSLAQFPFDLADISNSHDQNFPAHQLPPDKAVKAVSKAGGLTFAGAGFGIDYLFARNSGYSKQTAAIASTVGTATSVGLGALGTFAVTSLSAATGPVGLTALAIVAVVSASAGGSVSSAYKSWAEY